MLRGMFAFVIYDRLTHKMYGARDYFGIKPFYYATMNDTFLFGSEIKGFLPHPAFEKELDPDVMKMYLIFQYSPMEKTIFKGVKKLNPGTYFTYENGEMKTVRYFEPTFDPKKRSFDDTVKAIDDAVLSSVEYHQIADVEVGSFLSGGVDSSYVASVVKPMKTYSVGFEVGGFDETGLASELSKILGMPNTRREISADDFFAALPEYGTELFVHKKSKCDEAVALSMLKTVIPDLEAMNTWDHDSIYNYLVEKAAALEVKNATLMWPVRIAASGKAVTPGGAVEILDILGKDETVRRLKLAVSKLEA